LCHRVETNSVINDDFVMELYEVLTNLITRLRNEVDMVALDIIALIP